MVTYGLAVTGEGRVKDRLGHSGGLLGTGPETGQVMEQEVLPRLRTLELGAKRPGLEKPAWETSVPGW